MNCRTHDIRTSDGHLIKVFDWKPPGEDPKCVVQILHGLGEHAARYDRFANICNADGMAVVAHNHRGHGVVEGFGHYADRRGWDKVIADVLQVRLDIAKIYAMLPVVLLGHSMGSYIAQNFCMRHGEHTAAIVLSASTWAPRVELRIGHIAARILATIVGGRRISNFLNQSGLGRFNNPFQPARTEFDWLSRDEDEVDRYIADPLCGGQFTNQLWADLTGGLLEITADDAITKIRGDMPIMILGGEADPVGGQEGLSRLSNAYRRTGHDNITLAVYPGGRHEMLNETNRDEVTSDIINWIKRIGVNVVL